MSGQAAKIEAGGGARRWIVLLPLIVFAALAALFMIRLYAGDPSKLPSSLIGRPAPAFALPALPQLAREGRVIEGFDQAALADGRATIVNVFASWCVPCHQEHPLLMELAADPRVRMFGIAYKDEPDNSRRFLVSKGNPFARVGVDRNGRVGIDWGVYGVPETFVVDGKGVIIHKHVGQLTPESAARVREIARKGER